MRGLVVPLLQQGFHPGTQLLAGTLRNGNYLLVAVLAGAQACSYVGDTGNTKSFYTSIVGGNCFRNGRHAYSVTSGSFKHPNFIEKEFAFMCFQVLLFRVPVVSAASPAKRVAVESEEIPTGVQFSARRPETERLWEFLSWCG